MHPHHVVGEWIGSSEEVARKHFLEMTEELFQKATSNPTSAVKIGSSRLSPWTLTSLPALRLALAPYPLSDPLAKS